MSGRDYKEVLEFWFGRVEQTIVPTENRARIWFGEDAAIDEEINARFFPVLQQAIAGNLTDWESTAHGQLALIIVLDQFSRHIYRHSQEAFAQDEHALSICLRGLREQSDHKLSLIERVFYYFPLLHSEVPGYQEQSVRSYRTLVDLSFTETRVIFDSFFKFANHHYSIIQRFGRFPQRNDALSRQTTETEKTYLKEIEGV